MGGGGGGEGGGEKIKVTGRYDGLFGYEICRYKSFVFFLNEEEMLCSLREITSRTTLNLFSFGLVFLDRTPSTSSVFTLP